MNRSSNATEQTSGLKLSIFNFTNERNADFSPAFTNFSATYPNSHATFKLLACYQNLTQQANKTSLFKWHCGRRVADSRFRHLLVSKQKLGLRTPHFLNLLGRLDHHDKSC
jgi:hypothetical protein